MTRVLKAATVMIALGALAFGAIACSDDDDDGDNGDATQPAATQPAATQPAVTQAAATEPAGGTTVEIAAADFSFTPAEVSAPSGEPVTFVLRNTGTAPHTLTLYMDEAFTEPIAGADTGQVAPGASGTFDVTFEAAGDVYFRCEVHPTQMQGEISVD